jgi:hypothetical protein
MISRFTGDGGLFSNSRTGSQKLVIYARQGVTFRAALLTEAAKMILVLSWDYGLGVGVRCTLNERQ